MAKGWRAYTPGTLHPVTEHTVELSFRQTNDLSRQVQHITWRFDLPDTRQETSMALRWVFKEEFQLLLRIAGFRAWTLYGDFDRSEFDRGATELVWIAGP